MKDGRVCLKEKKRCNEKREYKRKMRMRREDGMYGKALRKIIQRSVKVELTRSKGQVIY